MREKILKDIVLAMKEKDKDRVSTLRLLKGAMQLEEINKKGVLDDNEIIGLISKQIKIRKESIVEFAKANREDLIKKTQTEISMLEEYMPEQLSDEEVDKIINDIFLSVNPKEMRDMKNIMSSLNSKLRGKTDMSLVSKKVKDRLTSIIGA